MKKLIIYFIIFCFLSAYSFVSCEKDFLQKPMGSDLNIDSVFMTYEKALGAIAQAYGQSAASGITILGWDGDRRYGMAGGTLSHISGELNALKFDWEDAWTVQRGGMNANRGNGMALSEDGYAFNYRAIRHNLLVEENIHKVVDLNDEEKERIRAEMRVLTAYRYQEMFKRYGGVPVVAKSLTGENNDGNIRRASLQDVLDHIIFLCDEAEKVLLDVHPPHFKGRATKGLALAVKAEALMYAARPLFNSAVPYMDLDEHNDLISFGNYSQQRWQDAIDASEAVIKWALDNGYGLINTGNPLSDYGTAVSTPGNMEVLFAYKTLAASEAVYSPRSQSGGANGMSFYQLQQYRKADGTDQEWPDDGVEASYDDYVERIEDMEPRYKASAAGAGMQAWNNPNSEWFSSWRLANYSDWSGRAGTEACGRRTKFWYNAGPRMWFEYPIYRLAEFYLNLAEAYNEIGNAPKALENLNIIRRRAGFTNDIDETDQNVLRGIIQREWAVEFYEEGHRLFSVKHWKLPDIDNGIIGGPKKSFVFQYSPGRSWGETPEHYVSYSVETVYTGFWMQNQFLTPFPQVEVNKGYLIQNPGY